MKCNDLTPTAPVYKALLSEHNRIAGELYSMNPFWDDTTLFLETRRAVAAIIQHITYNEFLPVLLGEINSTITLQHLVHTTAHRVSRFPPSTQNAEDVELIIGGAMEKAAIGAVIGPTLACVLALQFANLKKSDRFWYENDIPPSSFSPEQLAAIRKVSLAGMLCDAEESLLNIQPKAFLAAWRDESGAKAAEQLSKDMLATAIEKAKQEMAGRKRLEYMLWETHGGADPKSPVGTAASFSKANKYALKIANTSLFLEFATNELLNSINGGCKPSPDQLCDRDPAALTPYHFHRFHESIPDCRSCESPRTVHPECNPFPVPRGDHYYPEVNVTSGERLCFPFMRSLPGQQQLGPREQVNQNTAFIDGSVVYGENPCIVRKLRGFNGRLNATANPISGGKDLLPRSDSHPECKAASGFCFIAGDGRASEQPGLTAIHTIFLREHNRLIEGLRGVNPHWDAELLFEHARRILAAEFTHIIYNEFLPRLLSWNAVNLYGLKLLPAVHTFRIGHSLLRPHLPRLSHTFQPVEPPILLRDGFFKTDMFMSHPPLVDELMRGLSSTPMETLDQFITGEVTNHLFEDRRIPFSGIDLIALNIQRGRDHGVPSYNNYRALCNLKRATTFEDLSREVPDEVIARYENDNTAARFTEQQLAEIRRATLSKL
ncbi:Doubleoxidase, partial [Operophtera brumata]